MSKSVTRSDVIETAQAHGWTRTDSTMPGNVELRPLRDIFTKDRWTLSVSWNFTPFNSEPRFGYALLEGGDKPKGLPNIVGEGKRETGPCVVAVLKGNWLP